MDTERDKMTHNILAGCLDWTESILHGLEHRWRIDWHHAWTPDDLYGQVIERGVPDFIFFPHWRWKVPSWLLDHVPCVGFHLGDLPHGRGGSPIQWRILEGKRVTMVTAYRMTEVMDWGPIYCKRIVSLDGPLEDIFNRSAFIINDLICQVLAGCGPVPLEGDPADYPALPRREPEESDLRRALGAVIDLSTVYDLIRMVDHPDYPHAFLSVGNYVLTFSDASLEDGRLTARVDFL